MRKAQLKHKPYYIFGDYSRWGTFVDWCLPISHILLTKGLFFFLFMKATMIQKYFWKQKII